MSPKKSEETPKKKPISKKVIKKKPIAKKFSSKCLKNNYRKIISGLLLALIFFIGIKQFPFVEIECIELGGNGCFLAEDTAEIKTEMTQATITGDTTTSSYVAIADDPKWVNWDFPQSTPIRNRFFERPDEYQHFPVMQKGDIWTLHVELENAQNAHIFIKNNDILVLETKNNQNIGIEKVNETVSRLTIKIPINMGENKFKLLLTNTTGDPITERDIEIIRVEKVIMLYGDSLTTGYPEGRIRGVDKNNNPISLRTWFDAQSQSMTISKNHLAIPVPGKFDAAYEEGGLHIAAQDYLSEKGKNFFIWNEARNGETVQGAELRFELEGFDKRLANISEALQTDLKTDIVHIMLGTNDAREQSSEIGLDLKLWEENANKLINKILAQNIAPQNIIISFAPKNIYDPKDIKKIWQKIIQEKSITTGLDLSDIFTQHPEYLHEDKVHFNAKGKKEIGILLGKFLEK